MPGRNQDSDTYPGGNGGGGQPAAQPASTAPTYNYLRTDPDGTQVFAGNDGSLYTWTTAPGTPNGFAYVPYGGPTPKPNPNPSPNPNPNPSPAPAPGSSGGGGAPVFNPPAYDTPPAYEPPPPFKYDDFAAPTTDEFNADPGHQYRLRTGTEALDRSAAARGVLNTGGHLKDILGFGQELGSQDYGDMWNRKFQTYQTNRAGAFDTYKTNYGIGADTYDTNLKSQYLDPYSLQYQGSSDRYNSMFNAFKLNADLYDQDFNRRYRTLSLL